MTRLAGWRKTWLGKLLGVHSPSAHLMGDCWCQRTCAHPRRRCIHGDEINWTGGKRAQCLSCGRLLPRLPVLCSVTGRLHAHEMHGRLL